MSTPNTPNSRSRRPLLPHERLDAYWLAQMLWLRALHVVADAKCKSTIGRRLDTALGRVVRLIIEAADGSRELADARLGRARAAIGLALGTFDELALKASVRDVVIADLRERASVLLERLAMLEGKPVQTWPSSNSATTVVDEVKDDVDGTADVDVIVVLGKLPAAALRDLPLPVVAQDNMADGPSSLDDVAPPPVGDD